MSELDPSSLEAGARIKFWDQGKVRYGIFLDWVLDDWAMVQEEETEDEVRCPACVLLCLSAASH
ncbi:hypothetical protein ACQY0O_006678 [Thecaphora frezii]